MLYCQKGYGNSAPTQLPWVSVCTDVVSLCMRGNVNKEWIDEEGFGKTNTSAFYNLRTVAPQPPGILAEVIN